MNVALYTGRKVKVDDFSDPFEVHPTRHDLRTDQDPALTLPHPVDRVFPLFLGHPCVERIDIRDAVENQFLAERGRAGLC